MRLRTDRIELDKFKAIAKRKDALFLAAKKEVEMDEVHDSIDRDDAVCGDNFIEKWKAFKRKQGVDMDGKQRNEGDDKVDATV